MFKTILIAKRGDQLPPGSAAAQPNRLLAARQGGDITAECAHV
ncbi:hypothetical protein [Chitinimonas taiwanensis]|nr:hypothetical protein [Chitinimonas taiwanensis]